MMMRQNYLAGTLVPGTTTCDNRRLGPATVVDSIACIQKKVRALPWFGNDTDEAWKSASVTHDEVMRRALRITVNVEFQ
jgi:hypothetical protein